MSSGARPKIIQDCIHGVIRLPPCVIPYIDTPQFQRLRHLRQLGNTWLVYPSATHTRFEHSIGVSHLARTLIQSLREHCPEGISITDNDVDCVTIAGLCHDLGHGPYSHLWERFTKTFEGGKEFTHEAMSIRMFDRLREENGITLDEEDATFIKELIAGPLGSDGLPTGEKVSWDEIAEGEKVWPFKGRDSSKGFLYEIVANKATGIDVDKWDYFLRDDYVLKIGHTFDPQRFIAYARIKSTKDRPNLKRLALRNKQAKMLQDVLLDRTRLHHAGYQHRVALIANEMLLDAWKIAAEHLEIKRVSLCEAALGKNVSAYEKLEDDSLRHLIMESDKPEVKEAQKLLERIQKRDFYSTLASFKGSKANGEKVDTKQLIDYICKEEPQLSQLKDDLVVIRQKITQGGINFAEVLFYNKKDEVDSVEQPEPVPIEEQGFVCCKKNCSEELSALVQERVDQFFKMN